MNLEAGVKEKIQQLSILSRQVFGINATQEISFKTHPQFVSYIIKDITNIAYNLAIADDFKSAQEKALLLYTVNQIFYPNKAPNKRFESSIGKQFDKFNIKPPQIKSPIYILEQAKQYDKQFNTQITAELRDCIIAFGDAMVMADGVESIKEFDVMETFRIWVETIK